MLSFVSCFTIVALRVVVVVVVLSYESTKVRKYFRKYSIISIFVLSSMILP